MSKRAVVLIPTLLLLGGCTFGLGPRAVPRARFDYNEALSKSQNEQLMLNLLRLRYQDTTSFLDVDSIVSSYRAEGSAGFNRSLGTDAGSDTNLFGLNAGFVYSESPTISYSPLQGEAFARRFLSPIPPAMVALLAQSGWGLERLLRCCAHSLNGIPNTPSVGGYVPSRVLEFERFHAILASVKELQETGVIDWRALPDADGGLPLSYLSARPVDEAKVKLLEARLSVKEGGLRRIIATGPVPVAGDVQLQTRSLMGVLAFLAQGVEVPAEDLSAARVRIAMGPDGKPFDWEKALGGQFRIQSATSMPKEAFTVVRYRGHWFYIADADAETKATFSLLGQLFNLQASAGKAASPLLAVPIR